MYSKRSHRRTSSKRPQKTDSLEFTFGFTKWSLEILGLWPLKNSFSNFKFYISASMLLVTTITFSWGIQHSSDDDQLFVDGILYIMVLSCTTAKLFLVKYYQSNLKVIFTKMKADYNNHIFFNVATKKFIFLNVKLRKYLTYLMAFLLIASVVVSLAKLYQLSSGEFSMLREVYFIKHLPKWTLQSPIFEIMIVGGTGQLFFWAFTVLTIDSTFVVLVVHAYNRLQAICDNVKSYNERSFFKCTAKCSSKKCKCIKCIIDEHVATLRFIEDIEDTFNIILLIEVLRNSLHIGILINNLIWFYRTGSINPLEPMTILMSVSLHLVSFCGSIQSVTNAAQRIGKFAYELKWYDFQATTVQKISFIILRSQTPYLLTGGKYVRVSLETIRNIVAAAFSYSSLIMAKRDVLKENSFLDDSAIKAKG